jgi:large-conductance mechanosensitive channel
MLAKSFLLIALWLIVLCSGSKFVNFDDFIATSITWLLISFCLFLISGEAFTSSVMR